MLRIAWLNTEQCLSQRWSTTDSTVVFTAARQNQLYSCELVQTSSYQVSKLEVLYILSESTDQQHILPLYIV